MARDFVSSNLCNQVFWKSGFLCSIIFLSNLRSSIPRIKQHKTHKLACDLCTIAMFALFFYVDIMTFRAHHVLLVVLYLKPFIQMVVSSRIKLLFVHLPYDTCAKLAFSTSAC